jgi:predicted amidohydrolase
MRIIEQEDYPIIYKDKIIVYPEYFTHVDKIKRYTEKNKDKISIIGVGSSLPPYTRVQVYYQNKCFGTRSKISIFNGEGSLISPELKAIDVGGLRIGVVICREILHTAIAEIFRMMKVDIITVTIGGGDFFGLQRDSWIDQMCLFSDITNCDLICASGAKKSKGGLNLMILR